MGRDVVRASALALTGVRGPARQLRVSTSWPWCLVSSSSTRNWEPQRHRRNEFGDWPARLIKDERGALATRAAVAPMSDMVDYGREDESVFARVARYTAFIAPIHDTTSGACASSMLA